jgi:hypothetical protein
VLRPPVDPVRFNQRVYSVNCINTRAGRNNEPALNARRRNEPSFESAFDETFVRYLVKGSSKDETIIPALQKRETRGQGRVQKRPFEGTAARSDGWPEVDGARENSRSQVRPGGHMEKFADLPLHIPPVQLATPMSLP